jgi:hypothetical protein
LQETQPAPPIPHAALVDVTQPPAASQQPAGHETASQTHAPWSHAWPGGHVTHATPPLPHAEDVSVVTQ